jgi:hypothetical protein
VRARRDEAESAAVAEGYVVAMVAYSCPAAGPRPGSHGGAVWQETAGRG